MYRLIILLGILSLYYGDIVAQTITTNPDAPINTERPELENKFDWRNRNYKAYHPVSGYETNNNPLLLPNPFYQRESYQKHFNLFSYSLSLPQSQEVDSLDFNPEHGWEILHYNNGMMPHDQTTLITDPLLNRIGPYYIFYNKYSGTLRLMASFDNLGLNDKIVTTISLKQPTSSAPELSYTALFNEYGGISQPLDQKTEVIEVASVSKASINKGFISADFEPSYDPCGCQHESEMVIDFASLNEAQILLEGRLIATSVPLDGTGDSPLLNRKNFLTTVYKDGFSVNGGMLTYTNIDSLVAKYKEPNQADVQKVALDLFTAALKGGANALDKNFIDRGAAVVMNNIFDGLSFYKDQKKVGLGLLAAGAKSLKTIINPEHKVPKISFIEGEMVMNGTLEDVTSFNNGSINLAVPGSKNSKLKPWQYYPYYNKPLGIFALLKTPRVYYQTISEDLYPGGYHDDDYDFNLYHIREPLIYAFNPEARIDEDNTIILGAYEIKVKHSSGQGQTSNHSYYYQKNYNLQLIPNVKNENNTFISPFVPIENLVDLVVKQLKGIDWDDDRVGSYNGEWGADVEVNLKLLIEYNTLPNEYGHSEHGVKVLTYPVNYRYSNYVNEKFQDLSEIVEDVTIPDQKHDGTTSIPDHWEVRAGKSINFTGIVESTQGRTLKVRAPLVKISTGGGLKVGHRINVGLPLVYRTPYKAVSYSVAQDWCREQYKGNLAKDALKNKVKKIDISQEKKLNQLINCRIYPNPSKGQFYVDINLKNACNSKVEIFNASGQKVYSKEKKNIDAYTLSLNFNNFAKGVYVLKLSCNSQIVNRKIIIK